MASFPLELDFGNGYSVYESFLINIFACNRDITFLLVKPPEWMESTAGHRVSKVSLREW